ncbi:uncharacterized protein ARMOST_10324 [Armillaria ostoyae]|uniref:Uncharacterized protein n=1 Tax=Armillaria ostoyae TaxID=47428 RepID=A0A284RE01_ARMOS|nr:uncharacterized protein ARMOST_10324 [Armillaria ostoyae]
MDGNRMAFLSDERIARCCLAVDWWGREEQSLSLRLVHLDSLKSLLDDAELLGSDDRLDSGSRGGGSCAGPNKFTNEFREGLPLIEDLDDRSIKDIRGIVELLSGYGGGGETNGGRDGMLCEGRELLLEELKLESKGKKREGSI